MSYVFVFSLLTPTWPPQTHLRVQTQAWLFLRSPAGRSLLLPQRSHRATSCPVCVWRISCCAVRWPPSTRRWLQSSREQKTYKMVRDETKQEPRQHFCTSPFVFIMWFFTPVELNQTRLRADRWNSEQSQTDRMLRELRSHVDDLTEALSAKDSQLAVLKIRLDEADQLLKSRSAALDEVQKEKSRYTLMTTF